MARLDRGLGVRVGVEVVVDRRGVRRHDVVMTHQLLLLLRERMAEAHACRCLHGIVSVGVDPRRLRATPPSRQGGRGCRRVSRVPEADVET